MTRTVSCGGIEARVDVELRGATLTLAVEGAPAVTFDVTPVGASEWILRDGDRLHRVLTVRTRDATWVHVGGRTLFLREVVAARERGGGSPGVLVAPMTGRVVEVRVGNGDHVDAGATLLVLSAMKMHLEVKAPVAGVVSRLASVGEQVEGGATIAVIDLARSDATSRLSPSDATSQVPPKKPRRR